MNKLADIIVKLKHLCKLPGIELLLLPIIKALEEVVTEFEQKQTQLEKLQDQQKLNSQNSHKPPSTDFVKPKPALPKQKRKIGGQAGHKGSTLKFTEQPDKIVDLKVEKCTCGIVLTQQDQVAKRQVFDIPPITLTVTEYRQFACTCPSCGLHHKAVFPEFVNAPVQYGAHLQSLSVNLQQICNVSIEKVQHFCKDLLQQQISTATLISFNRKAYFALASFEEALKQRLLASPVVHADESGFYVNQQREWIHSLSADVGVYLYVEQKRGLSEDALIRNYKQVLVHDCWRSYFDLGCRHALCGAHLLRELQHQVEIGRRWAVWMRRLLLYSYRASAKGLGQLPSDLAERVSKLYYRICSLAEVEEPEGKRNGKRGQLSKSKGRNLLNRLITHKDAVLLFSKEQVVPFTNNSCERSLRVIKTKLKVIGSFRTETGGDYYARMQSFYQTIRKQGQNPHEQLVAIFKGKPYTWAR